MLNFIKQHIEYPIGLFVGFLGKSLGLSVFINTTHLTEKIVDGVIGIVFLCIGVIVTHYLKKALNKKK